MLPSQIDFAPRSDGCSQKSREMRPRDKVLVVLRWPVLDRVGKDTTNQNIHYLPIFIVENSLAP